MLTSPGAVHVIEHDVVVLEWVGAQKTQPLQKHAVTALLELLASLRMVVGLARWDSMVSWFPKSNCSPS
jgi:hypothetical protein